MFYNIVEIMHSTKIKLDNISNIRDLYPIRNRDGMTIRRNRLFRSECLYRSSEDDMAILYEKCNLRKIIDLRTRSERLEKPDPSYRDIVCIDNPVQDEPYVGVTQDEESIRKRREYFRELDKKMLDDSFREEHMCEFYGSLFKEEYALKGYASFIDELLDSEDGVLWHCSLGRDRCGMATVLVLELLDVERETIIEDYLYTNECLINPISIDYAYREYIEAFYRSIEENYGSIDNLFRVMGIDVDKKKKFKEKYLEVSHE